MEEARRYTTVADCRVHSVHIGAGEPVVLIHGLAGSHRWWRWTIPALTGEHTVHVPELLGFGGGRAPSRLPDLPGAAALLADWMDAIGVGSADIVGHSLGGQIAIHLAAERPERVRRLVLVAAAGIPRSIELREAWRFLAELVPPRAWGKLAFVPTIAADAMRAGPRLLAGSLVKLLRDDVRPLLPRIRARTLVIWGEQDPLLPLRDGRAMARAIPGAQLVVLAQAAHNPMVDAPEAFNTELVRFLGAE